MRHVKRVSEVLNYEVYSTKSLSLPITISKLTFLSNVIKNEFSFGDMRTFGLTCLQVYHLPFFFSA